MKKDDLDYSAEALTLEAFLASGKDVVVHSALCADGTYRYIIADEKIDVSKPYDMALDFVRMSRTTYSSHEAAHKAGNDRMIEIIFGGRKIN